MIENLIWNFPKANHATQQSSDNNNIDTFADDRLKNLVRETIQNSLDAFIEGKPTLLEFRTFETATNVFPAIDTFKDYLTRWKSVREKNNLTDDKDYLFVCKILTELSNDKIKWIRISDFNTTGLWGITSKFSNTPYFSFIHGAGLNSKQNQNSGGSKGTGKNAIFANSIFQTMFVSTYTKDEERGFIGVGFLPSLDENNVDVDWTSGVGYCVLNDENKTKNKPVQQILNIDSKFNREKRGYGTDIYIPGFLLTDKWMQEIIGQTIISFFPAIYQKKLAIKVIDGNGLGVDETIELNADTLKDIISQKAYFKNSVQKTEATNIYNVFTSPNKKKFKYTTDIKDEMDLLLVQDEFNGDNKLYIYRCPTDMLIEIRTISAFVKCSGVLLLKGNDLTQKLKSIEDATHSKWSRSKAIKTKYSIEEIDEALKVMNDFIDLKTYNFGNEDSNTESDFDYLIENDWCSSSDDHEIIRETQKDLGLAVSKPVFSIRNDPSKHSKQKHALKRKSNKINESGDAENYLLAEGLEGEEVEAILPSGHNNGGGGEIKPIGVESEIDEVDNGSLKMVRKTVETPNAKIISINPREGQFKLIFTPKSSGKDVEIAIFIIGEGLDDNIAIKVLKAKLGFFPLKTKRNIIFMKQIERGNRVELTLELDIKENYIMEVNVSANE